MTRILIALLVTLALLAIYWLDREMLWLGHPIWQVWVIVALVAAGSLLAALLPRPALWQALLAGLVAAVAAYLSASGKADFAASYAEDTAAGRLWYLGYHALAGLAAFALMRFARLRTG